MSIFPSSHTSTGHSASSIAAYNERSCIQSLNHAEQLVQTARVALCERTPSHGRLEESAALLRQSITLAPNLVSP
jgi:hypothetical protein